MVGSLHYKFWYHQKLNVFKQNYVREKVLKYNQVNFTATHTHYENYNVNCMDFSEVASANQSLKSKCFHINFKFFGIINMSFYFFKT
jgi:hypothetical protein